MSQTTPRSSLPFGGRLTLAWLHCYTAGLSAPIRDDRRDEVTGDVWDHLLDDGPAAIISRAIARRMLLGVPADLSWRTEQARRQRRTARERVAMIELNTRTRRLVTASLTLGMAQVALIGAGLAVVFATWFSEDESTADRIIILIAFLGFLLGLRGVVSLIRTRRVGSGALSLASLLMTLPFYWNPLMTFLGIALGTLHLAAFGLVREATNDLDASTNARVGTA